MHWCLQRPVLYPNSKLSLKHFLQISSCSVGHDISIIFHLSDQWGDTEHWNMSVHDISIGKKSSSYKTSGKKRRNCKFALLIS